MKSRTKLLTFISEKIEPINKNFETRLFELYSIENMTIKIKDAKSSIRSNETKHLSQDLNMKEVERSDRVRNANGEISTNTLIKIYLIEYIKTRFRKPIETIVLIIPSMENTFEEFSSILIIESEILINFEKHICILKN